MSLKICENVVLVSNSLDPDETSPSHPDPSCLHVLGGLRVNLFTTYSAHNLRFIDAVIHRGSRSEKNLLVHSNMFTQYTMDFTLHCVMQSFIDNLTSRDMVKH